MIKRLNPRVLMLRNVSPNDKSQRWRRPQESDICERHPPAAIRCTDWLGHLFIFCL